MPNNSAKALAYETFGEDGIVGIRTLDDVVVSDDLDKLLDFLQFTGKRVIRTAFEIDTFVAPILRKLPTDKLQELVDRNETNIGRFRIYYLRRNMLQVGKVGNFAGTRYYGVKNFLNIPGILPTPSLEEVQETSQEILDAVDGIGFSGEHLRLTSPGAVFLNSNIGKDFMLTIPLGRDIPASVVGDVTELSALADDKYWVSAYQLGKWEQGEVYDYDLTSAFSSVAASLPDIRDLSFWRSETMGKREQSALYGVVCGRFYIDPAKSHLSPIVAELPNGLQGNPAGWLGEDCYTMDEIRTVERYDIGEFTQTGLGVFAHPYGGVQPRQPYKDMMNWLYEKRQWSEMAGLVAKVAGNAIIGKMVEKRDNAEYRNRFYHAQITAITRCLVTKFLAEYDVQPSEILCVQTDGVKLTRDIPLRNGRMGQWRNNGSDKTIVHSARKVYTADKRPFKITLADVERLVAEHPNIERYSLKAPYRITLSEALDAGDIGKVGEVVNMPTSFDFIAMDLQLNRHFPDLPKCGRDLLTRRYQSETVNLGGE